MPVTHRHAVHDGKTGLSHCINYCKDPMKTDGGKYVTGINCSKTFAIEEFLMIHEKYNSYISDDERICYHAWQSFDYRDDLSPAQAHEIGVTLCKELYPDFQCMVCTHLDRGHLHNHIIINSRNLEGRKLEDRLANTTEGLYGLRDASDRIALSYGCSVIENAPKISRYKTKNYKYQASEPAQKTILIQRIDALKETCNSFDELLEHLSFDGYVIKRGKQFGVLPAGRQKKIRFKTLGSEYSEDSLRQFFYEKQRLSYQYNFKQNMQNTNGKSEVIDHCVASAENAKQAILKSEHGLHKESYYPKYFNSRYMEMKRYNKLIESIRFLNQEGIYTYDDLIDRVSSLHAEIELLDIKYKKSKSENNTLQARLEYAELYIQNYHAYCIYEENQHMFTSSKITTEVKDFLYAKEQLNHAEVEEVKEYIAHCSKQKLELNQQYARLSYLRNKASDLDELRMINLDTDPKYIKGISFRIDMIDEDRSKPDQWCVRIPYTNHYVFLDKDCVLWTDHGKRAIMYLIDDKSYDIYDQKGHLIDSLEGEQLVLHSHHAKEAVILSKRKNDYVSD